MSSDDMFWSKVKVGDKTECWPWRGSLNRGGYGQSWHNKKLETAHRRAFRLIYGSIPPGGWILHSCDNPRCCNPSHLRIGNHSDNCQDKISRNRQSRLFGGHNGRTKLTGSQVNTIKMMADVMSQRKLAKNFGVSQSHISNILSGRRRGRET